MTAHHPAQPAPSVSDSRSAIGSRSGWGNCPSPASRPCGMGQGHSYWVFSYSQAEAGERAGISLTLERAVSGVRVPGWLPQALAEFLAQSKHSKNDWGLESNGSHVKEAQCLTAPPCYAFSGPMSISLSLSEANRCSLRRGQPRRMTLNGRGENRWWRRQRTMERERQGAEGQQSLPRASWSKGLT